MSGCNEFRARLAASLVGRPAPPAPRVAWHEHLVACAACRALLEDEEALEAVLASLPEPALPPDLAERVLARLAGERVTTLDGLLDLNRVAATADRERLAGLAARVLSGLEAARERERLAGAERRLDALLDRVPAPDVPDDLAERVLAAVRPRPRLFALRGGLAWAALAAAAAVLALVAWRFTRTDGVAPLDAPPRNVAGGSLPAEPRAPEARGGADDVDDELLASLDVLERWDLLTDEDLAVLLASMDAVDEELLDLAYSDEEEEDEG